MSIGNKGILAATLLAAAAAPAMAGYTTILSSGEPNLHAIFTGNYGTLSVLDISALSAASTFTAGPAGPLQYTFTRVHDTLGGLYDPVASPTDLHASYAGTTTDQRFSDGVADVRFLVKHAGFTNRLGFTNKSTPGSLVDADFTGLNGADIIGSTVNSTAQVTLSGNFQFGVKVNGQANNYYGSHTDIENGDHFVTWRVTGQGRSFWVLAIEDLNLGDRDYNDWVGELAVIPVPPAAWAGLTTLAGVGLFGFIRRRRQLA